MLLNRLDYFILLSLIALSFCSTTVKAQDCYTKSPNLITLKDDYFKLGDQSEISKQQIKKLKLFFNGLKGSWVGSSTELLCKGSERSPRIETKQGRIKTSLSISSDNALFISADIKFTDEKRVDHQTINILAKSERPAIYDLRFNSDTHLTFSQRYRRASGNGKSRHTEVLYDITYTSSKLTLSRRYYYSGSFVADEVWELKKGRY